MKSPIKRHGGKFYLANWIVGQFPGGYTHYTEAYAGSLAVLLAADHTCVSESVNDLDRQLSDFWFVLANTPDRLLRRLWGTPLSQEEWTRASSDLEHSDRVRRATAFFIRCRQSRQALCKDYVTPTRRTRRGMNEHASSWWSAIEGLAEVHQRLRGVEVRNMPALAFLEKYDHPDAMHYIDPPYLPETRTATSAYGDLEMTQDNHWELLDFLPTLKGRFALSGYMNGLYKLWATKHDYRCVEKQIDNKASGAKSKPTVTECLWMNY